MRVEQNTSRLKHLLALPKMTEGDFLLIFNERRKKLTVEDVFSNEISVRTLKRIDKVFNLGLHYYLDPETPTDSREASIFFRKNKFGTELNIGAKKIGTQFEELKISLPIISKLAEINLDRSLPVSLVQDNPQTVANAIRKKLYPDVNSIPKEFLRALISKFAEKNILVFEFVETWNKKEKANIDGFFLSPNLIVLKRQHSSFRRETFTLIQEFGHYLLNKEEIEELDIANLPSNTPSAIERWCNDFSYYFLIG